MSPTFNRTALSIRAIRTATGFSQDEVAAILRVTGSTISEWERGKRRPYKINKIAIEKLYNQVCVNSLDLTEEQWGLLESPDPRQTRTVAPPCTEPLPLVNWWIPYGAIFSIMAAAVAFGLWVTQ